MRYRPVDVNIDDSQEKRLTRAIKNETGVSLRIIFEPSKTLLFTKNQIGKMERTKLLGKGDIIIKMSSAQVKANTKHEGGFLWSLAARIAPALLTGVMSALASKATQKVMSKKGRGLYLQKNGHCAKVKLVDGGGLFLAPHNKFHAGKGLFEAEGAEIKGGAGLLFGDNSPFKSIPLLNILL